MVRGAAPHERPRGHALTSMQMPRLLFADDRGTVYDHPELLAAVRTGDAIVRPARAAAAAAGGRHPLHCSPAAARRPRPRHRRAHGAARGEGRAPAGGPARGRRDAAARLHPHAAPRRGAPAARHAGGDARRCRSGPTPPPRSGPTARWCSRSAPTGAATGTPPATPRPTCRAASSALVATGNPIYRQLARCALEWRCFTAQNTFYGRDEGAIPSSASCNAACVGCLSEQDEGMPPSSHERIARPPTAEEMADLAVRHLEAAHRQA